MTSRGFEKKRKEIQALEEQMRNLESQIGETAEVGGGWHDNACLDHLNYDIRILNERLRIAYTDILGAEIREYPRELTEKRVDYGTKVRFKRNGQLQQVCLVGFGESDFERGLLVYNCPLGLALSGRAIGESFMANINGRPERFSIEEVEALDANYFTRQQGK